MWQHFLDLYPKGVLLTFKTFSKCQIDLFSLESKESNKGVYLFFNVYPILLTIVNLVSDFLNLCIKLKDS